MTETHVDVAAASAVQPVDEVPAAGPQPPTVTTAAPSPAAEAPREPKPETVALATFEDFEAKPAREDDLILSLPQPDGTLNRRRVHGKAIDGPAYDELVSRCPPTREQQGRQMSYNPDTFEPLLLSEVITAPKLTPEQWAHLRAKPEWSGGEWATLAIFAQGLCMQGLNVPFSRGA